MLDKKDLKEMRTEFAEHDDFRELIIKKSRDVLKLSKQVIYAVHRDENADKLVDSINKELSELNKLVAKSTKLEAIGAYRVAVQEYVEALLYYNFVKENKIPSHKDLKVEPEHYLLGLIDLTGELVRRAVFLAGKGKYSEVIIIRDLVDEVYGELLHFDFRENELRKKFDSVKYDLKKLEDLVLELKLKGKL